jgi:pimeloyl-ACP methyl ester carboxylesterase
MRALCRKLTFVTIQSGHWMAQERPAEVNAALARWLATEVPGVWPQPQRG